jgi:hypothetical protein
MVMPAIGDIVTIRRIPGRWAVIGPHPQDERRWRVRRDGAEVGYGPPQGRTAGDGDLEVLAHPIFSAGQVVTFSGREAKVVRDEGGATVGLRYLALRGRSLDRRDGFYRTPTVAIGEADVERGELVAEQLAFVRGRTTDG